MIAFDGEVVNTPFAGRYRVRLDNGHVVTALPPLGEGAGIAGRGERVVVEIAFNQLKGWRLERRP